MAIFPTSTPWAESSPIWPGANGCDRLTGDTMGVVDEVSIRDLRNHGGEVIDRVERGERLTITRDGRQVAELRPLDRRPASAGEVIRRWSRLPRVDPNGLRRDLDQALEPSL